MKSIAVTPSKSKVLRAVMAKGQQAASCSTWTQSHSVHSNHSKNSR
jgi:hypothetical protein